MKFFLKYSLVFFFVNCFSQNDLHFKHVSIASYGINYPSQQCFDSKGLMWGVYEEGLFNYSGYGVNKIQFNPEDTSVLLSKNIGNLFIDAQDNLWLTYINKHYLTFIDTKKNNAIHYKLNFNAGDKENEIVVSKLFIDSKNRFWMLTWGAGICSFDKNTGKIISYLPHGKNPNVKKPEYANCSKGIFELKNGNFFLASFGNEFVDLPHNIFNPNTKEFTPFAIKDYTNGVNSKEFERIEYAARITNFVYVDNDENIWLGTYCGLLFFDTKNKSAQRISQLANTEKFNLENVRNFVIDDDNNVWMGTPNLGVIVVNIKSKKINYYTHNIKIPTTIADNRIGFINKDKQGNIWMSTKIGTFSVYNRLQQQFFIASWTDMNLDFYDRAVQRVPVNQLYVKPNGELLIANENGILVYDANERTITKTFKPNLYSNKFSKVDINASRCRVQDIKPIDDKNYFITSPNYPALFNSETGKFKEIKYDNIREQTAMRFMFRHSNTSKFSIALHYADGWMFMYDSLKNSMSIYAGLNKFPGGYQENYSFITPNGDWVFSGGPKQFTIYNPTKRKQLDFNAKSKTAFFPDSTIKMVSLNGEGNLYISTQNGLYEFSLKDYSTKKLNKEVGLEENESINTINEQNDSIKWIAGDKQLMRWNKNSKQLFRFNSDLGLPEGSFINSVPQKDTCGRLYFATFNGELIIDPSKIIVPDFAYNLHLNKFLIKEKSFDLSQLKNENQLNEALKWNENFLSFELYTEQIFTPTPYTFKYRLFGLDSTWRENGIENKIRYTNLSSGEYTLQVKALNSYYKESNIFVFSFSISPPFWKTWWFYLLIAISFALIIKLLINRREKSLLKKQKELENKIAERTQEVVNKANEIESQKNIIEHKNKELTDSINYALRIQQSILPTKEQIKLALPQHFIFYQPKDIVSGDFYWFSKVNEFALWAAVDCTGHGVPGGFMSMLGSDLLNQIVNEEKELQPNLVLNKLRLKIISALKQTGAAGENKDGMDISLCKLNMNTNELEFAGANNSLLVVRNNKIIKLQSDKQPIGIYLSENKDFTNHYLLLETNDVIYMTTDGYVDQFGGEKGKKFKSSNFEKLICEIAQLPIDEQEQKISSTFINWKEGFEQLDDVCVIGVKI